MLRITKQYECTNYLQLRKRSWRLGVRNKFAISDERLGMRDKIERKRESIKVICLQLIPDSWHPCFRAYGRQACFMTIPLLTIQYLVAIIWSIKLLLILCQKEHTNQINAAAWKSMVSDHGWVPKAVVMFWRVDGLPVAKSCVRRRQDNYRSGSFLL